MITMAQLLNIMKNAGPQAEAYLDPLNAAMDEFLISALPQRQAMFLAQVAHESGELRRVSENLNYSAQALVALFPKHFTEAEAADYARQPEPIANRLYANRMGNQDETSGDGWKFRGRGLIQITGRDNYAACGAALGLDLVTTPDLLLQPEWGAASAAWFFSRACLPKADAGDVVAITRIINGGLIGLAERQAYYKAALAELT